MDALQCSIAPGSVVCSNLPYGERVGAWDSTLQRLYRGFGQRVRDAANVRLIALLPSRDAGRALGLGPPGRDWWLSNGGMDTALMRWDLGTSPP
jgi:23S rRNA G2445 N2-methylase RlmL